MQVTRDQSIGRYLEGFKEDKTAFAKKSKELNTNNAQLPA
jgi:hypothetical protein